ncbi:MAG: type 1 glutamine amidotransferase domain-containing protein [Acidiferrobacter sp.]
MAKSLQGKRVAMLLTDGVEQVEYEKPRKYLEERGAAVDLIAPKKRGEKVLGFNHLTPGTQFTVDKAVEDARPEDYDALVLPGGVANPDQLRLSARAIEFVSRFAQTGHPVAAICHGPWLLINAGLVSGRHFTSWPSLEVDLKNAGGLWTDEPVVVDGRFISSRKPDDIPVFNEQIEKALLRPQTARA